MAAKIDSKIKAFLRDLSYEALEYFFPSEEEQDIVYGLLEPLAASTTCPNISKSSIIQGDAPDIRDFSLDTDMVFETAKASDVMLKTFETEPGEKMQEMLEEIGRLQEKYGISLDELIAHLRMKVKLSHMEISRNGGITLTDFDYRDVPMRPLTKTVFLLFLNHPEGIFLKDIGDHRKEMEDIYLSITGRSDLAGIRDSLDKLADPLDNSINEKISNVRKAFLDVVNDNVAQFYYIQGTKGTAKKILLDRSYVIRED